MEPHFIVIPDAKPAGAGSWVCNADLFPTMGDAVGRAIHGGLDNFRVYRLDPVEVIHIEAIEEEPNGQA